MSPESVNQPSRILAPAVDNLANVLAVAVPGGRVQAWVRGSEAFPYTATIGVSEAGPAGGLR